MVINPALNLKMPYDTLKDFAPVTLVVVLPLRLVVHPSQPAKSVKELVALAKAREPVGNSTEEFAAHIRAELAKWVQAVKVAGVKPHQGSPDRLQRLIGASPAHLSAPVVAPKVLVAVVAPAVIVVAPEMSAPVVPARFRMTVIDNGHGRCDDHRPRQAEINVDVDACKCGGRRGKTTRRCNSTKKLFHDDLLLNRLVEHSTRSD